MALFDRQDEEDDFSGVTESSRAEVADIRREIYRTFMDLTCLLILNNGSDEAVDIASFGFPLNDWYNLRDNRMLWTFRGRLPLNPEIEKKVDDSHLFLYTYYYAYDGIRKALLATEATEITRRSRELLHLDSTIAAECCLYLLSLNYQGGHNWATHACNYWVCDGIIFSHPRWMQEDQAWELAAALHQEIRLEDYSCSRVPVFADELDTPPERWILVTKDAMEKKPTLYTTSLFVGYTSVILLPNDMFHQANNLRVLRLCNCAFSFSSPPFRCCSSLRFLGLDKCQDRPQEDREDKNMTSPALEIFHRLWVLDICHTDWELTFPTKNTTEQQMAVDIREVHIKKGRIWHNNFPWRQLKNLRKLRVIEATHPWGKTGEMDEFADMLKLELLDLSKNNMIQVLPRLSGAGNLKILILDGCVRLEQVGPEGIPPSLESFSFDSRIDRAEITSISLAGCSSLLSFTLRGPLPKLENLDLSGTIIKMLDLRDVQGSRIGQMIMLRCEKLHSIIWPEKGLPNLSVLCIDSQVCHVETNRQQAYATVMDVRFIQSLVLRSEDKFCWKCDKTHVNICMSSTAKEAVLKNGTIGCYNTQKVAGSSLQMSIINITQPVCYKDINLDMISAIYEGSSAPQVEPLDLHVEIGEGISYVNMVSEQALSAVAFVMNGAESLHAHDNSLITSLNPPKHVILRGDGEITWQHLKWCCIERCRRLDTVFATDYTEVCFRKLESFSAAELLMANSIWGRGSTIQASDDESFKKLRSIHLYSCRKLTFVLPLSWATTRSHLPSLETLLIVCCGELRQVFPVEPDALSKISFEHPTGVRLNFPKLKHIHLHDVPKLRQICDVKRMFAPELKTIRVRGCWSLKRIPASDSCPVVDCEKDWWEKLEWDGVDVGHDPSLFKTRHSRYYKKAMPRGSLLR
uniref:Disease resistance protein At4g27190-like leucine-rich repeats domain-containing protein n=1 Tax=Leersia perrieri TaxID=77586 RepID=A0A0D9W283_9ORYZ